MSPRPAPDLTARRDRVLGHTRRIAEAEGWAAVTIRRLATELGVTQPVLYTAFGKRQDIVDAVALLGFAELGRETPDRHRVPALGLRDAPSVAEDAVAPSRQVGCGTRAHLFS